MTLRELTPMKWMNMKWLAAVVLAFWCCCGAVQANVTNAIWQAKIGGTLAIQRFTTNVRPRLSVASFGNSGFLRMVLSGSPTSSQRLALNIDMAQGQTNFYLSVYDRVERQNLTRLTTAETTTIVATGDSFVFSLEAQLLPVGAQWGGGFIRICGRGRMVNGVPAVLRGRVEGTFIDNRPGDLNGTTGLVLRSKISTSGPPLRIQPAN